MGTGSTSIRYPDARSIDGEGRPVAGAACPLHPAYREWLAEGLQRLFGSDSEGELYAELLAHWHAGTLTDEHERVLDERRGGTFGGFNGGIGDYERYKFWRWLWRMSKGIKEPHTISFHL